MVTRTSHLILSIDDEDVIRRPTKKRAMIDDDDSDFSLPNQDSLINAMQDDTPKKIQPKKMPPMNLQN